MVEVFPIRHTQGTKMQFYYKLTMTDGTESSDQDSVNGTWDDVKQYVDDMRSGITGMDIDNIDRITVWDDNGNSY